jgi:hypothetical protein
VFSDAQVSVGASGAIFGLFGVLLVADRVHKPALTRQARNLTMQIGVLIGINLVIGFSVPEIDNAAHIGGLIAGCWLGLTVIPRDAITLAAFWSGSRPGERSRVVLRPWMLALVGFLVVAAFVVAAVLIGPMGFGQ